MTNSNKTYSIIAVSLIAIQIILVLYSWIYSAVCIDSEVRSLLSGEGIRWLALNYADFISSPVLLWILIMAITYSAVKRSGLIKAICNIRKITYLERIGLSFSAVLFFIYWSLVFYLSFTSDAVLLSVTGGIFPSPLTSAFIPILSLSAIMCSIIHGYTSRNFSTTNDFFESLYSGIRNSAPLILLYILCALTYCSAYYMFFTKPPYV